MADLRNVTMLHSKVVSRGEASVSSVVDDELSAPQAVTAAPTLKLLAYVSETSEVAASSMEFHMTIRAKISNLTPKQSSMLLSVACWRAVHLGVDFTLYLAMEYLYNSLWRNGTDPMYVANDKVRKTLMVNDIIMNYIRGTWLTFKEYETLPEQVVDEIIALNWLPTERTIQSWRQHWKLEKYIEVKIVPVEHLLNRSKYSSAERYSGYTKGYGNDGSPARVQRTKPTAELDGDDSEKPLPQLSLQEFEEYQTAIRLIEFARAARTQEK